MRKWILYAIQAILAIIAAVIYFWNMKIDISSVFIAAVLAFVLFLLKCRVAAIVFFLTYVSLLLYLILTFEIKPFF